MRAAEAGLASMHVCVLASWTDACLFREFGERCLVESVKAIAVHMRTCNCMQLKAKHILIVMYALGWPEPYV
jgi:hypothetical protein